MLIKFDFSSKTGILVVKFAFATANLKIETLRMRRRFARVSIAPKQNASLQFVLCTIDPQCWDDCCRLYGFVFFFGEETKTKYCLAKIFEIMVGVELLEGYERAVCGTCRYSICW